MAVRLWNESERCLPLPSAILVRRSQGEPTRATTPILQLAVVERSSVGVTSSLFHTWQRCAGSPCNDRGQAGQIPNPPRPAPAAPSCTIMVGLSRGTDLSRCFSGLVGGVRLRLR